MASNAPILIYIRDSNGLANCPFHPSNNVLVLPIRDWSMSYGEDQNVVEGTGLNDATRLLGAGTGGAISTATRLRNRGLPLGQFRVDLQCTGILTNLSDVQNTHALGFTANGNDASVSEGVSAKYLREALIRFAAGQNISAITTSTQLARKMPFFLCLPQFFTGNVQQRSDNGGLDAYDLTNFEVEGAITAMNISESGPIRDQYPFKFTWRIARVDGKPASDI